MSTDLKLSLKTTVVTLALIVIVGFIAVLN
ncbi:YnhF family membrane protein [uncultured Cedecea sp.]|nr:YnhF family membrane protein [uncultured Cedecea sp.]MCS3429637.1 hypothetical protein [Klebsiella sp. BIGb0407]